MYKRFSETIAVKKKFHESVISGENYILVKFKVNFRNIRLINLLQYGYKLPNN